LGRCSALDLARFAAEELLAATETPPGAVSALVLSTGLPAVFPPFPARVLAHGLGLAPETITRTVTEGEAGPFLALTDFEPFRGLLLLVGAASATAAMGRHEGGGSLLDRASADPDSGRHLSAEADDVAARFGLSRLELDSFAIESHSKAARAQEEGRLERETVPVLPPPDYEGFVRNDEAVQGGANARRFGALPPVRREGGAFATHANLGLPGDGAAALLLEPVCGDSAGGTVILRAAVWGVPEGEVGAAYAVRELVEESGASLEETAALELHERSAAHVLAALKRLGFGLRQKVNLRGGAIALGDVPGASVIRHFVSLAVHLGEKETGIVAAGAAGLCGAALLRREDPRGSEGGRTEKG